MDTNLNITNYIADLYLRLSKEDGDKAESDSIGNQRDLILAFIERHPEITLRSIRVDDGYTGVNFERPSFIAMMEAVKNKEINCIIVKDFSRLGRNFIETGKYIEKIFPFMGVRFISINDNYDSAQPKTASDNLIVPVKNLMNDAYCRDISIKIRSQLDIKRRKGECIAPFAVFGYLKYPDNKNKLMSKTNHIRKYDCEYARKGTCSIFMFTEPLGAWREAHALPQRRAEDWAHQMKWLIDEIYPDVDKLVLVMDNLNTHTVASFYKYFPSEEAFRLAQRLEIHYTPKHGSWLDIAEIELSALSLQCLENRRISSIDALNESLSNWFCRRNSMQKSVSWQFTATDARIKLKHLYPEIVMWIFSWCKPLES